MTDHIVSFFDNYKSKIRNPFIGTMISVWIIRNWVVLYALLSFDNNRTMEWKIKFISDYFLTVYFWGEFWHVIGISFFSLLITFILLGISRGLTDFYYKIIEPFIVTKIDKGQIFTKKDKKTLENRIAFLDSKLEKVVDAVYKAEEINEKLQLKLQETEKLHSQELELMSNSRSATQSQYEHMRDQTSKWNAVFEKFDEIHQQLSNDMEGILINLRDNHSIIAPNDLKANESIIKLLEFGFLKYTKRNDTFQLTEFGSVFVSKYLTVVSKVETI